MNRNGRIIGGTLIGLALLWILRIAGALPFNNQSTNQIATTNSSTNPNNTNQVAAAQDRPPVESADASRPGGTNTSTGTQGFGTGGSSASPDATNPPGSTSSIDTTTGQSSQPIRAGW